MPSPATFAARAGAKAGTPAAREAASGASITGTIGRAARYVAAKPCGGRSFSATSTAAAASTAA